MGDNRGSAENQPPDFGAAGSWQERAPSPRMATSFTQGNSIPQPRSPLLFSHYFDDFGTAGSWQESVPSPLKAISFTQGNSIPQPRSPFLDYNDFGAAGSWQESVQSPHMAISFTQGNSLPQPRSPFSDHFDGHVGFNQMLGSQNQGYIDGSMQPNDVSTHPYFGISLSTLCFNQQLDTPTSSQTPPLRFNFNQQQNYQAIQRQPSKDQRFRQRKKEKEEAKDREIVILKQQILMKDDELARLRSENEILRNNNDEQLARLISEIEMLKNNKDTQIAPIISEIEMLRNEITSIKHNNILLH